MSIYVSYVSIKLLDYYLICNISEIMIHSDKTLSNQKGVRFKESHSNRAKKSNHNINNNIGFRLLPSF